jgi:hypothetical protein
VSWVKLLQAALQPAIEWAARKLFEDDGKAQPKPDPEAAEAQRQGTAAGEGYRQASRKAGPKR